MESYQGEDGPFPPVDGTIWAEKQLILYNGIWYPLVKPKTTIESILEQLTQYELIVIHGAGKTTYRLEKK